MTSTIRMGIVGTGGMANWHARQFLASGRCQVVAACDIDGERAAAFAKTHGAEQVFTDYRELLARGELDAVSIVTSNDAHHPVAVAALEAGLHVLCEKPLALTLEQAQEMHNAAVQAGTITVVNFTHRNTPCFTLARQIISGGHLGEIYHVQCNYLQDWMLRRTRRRPEGPAPWRLDKRAAGSGQLGDLGAHILDLLHGVVGDVVAVSAQLPTFAQLHGDDLPAEALTDDLAALQLTCANGAVVHAMASRVATGLGDNMTLQVYGREGALLADDLKRMEAQACIGPFQVERRGWTTFALNEQEVEPNPAQLFVQGIVSGQQPPMSFADGLWVQRILDAAQRSAAEGRRVKVTSDKLPVTSNE